MLYEVITEVEDFLAQGLDLMGLSLDNQPEALARLALYFQELNKWNSKVNLVARTLDRITSYNVCYTKLLRHKNCYEVSTPFCREEI